MASNLAQFFTAGGDGVSPGVGFFGYATGKYYGPSVFPAVAVTRTLDANRVYYSPFWSQEAHSFTGISVQQTNAAPTGNVRLGVYNNSAGAPGSLLIDAGVVAFPGSTGIRTVTATITLAARTAYWLAFVSDAAVNALGAEATGGHTVMASLGSYSTLYIAQNGFYGGTYAAFTYGALPSTATAPTLNADVTPYVVLKG